MRELIYASSLIVLNIKASSLIVLNIILPPY